MWWMAERTPTAAAPTCERTGDPIQLWLLSVEAHIDRGRSEHEVVHVVWLTSGLGCDGESLALTAATSPSLEDLLGQAIPGAPSVVLHSPVLAYDVGDTFMQDFYDAEDGRLEPYLLVLEGALGNERINGDGHWSGLGVDPQTGQPITTNEWIDRLAPRAAAVVAVGTCATYGGVPAMKNNPTGAMGLPDYLGWSWKTKSGVPIVCLPGCPTQPDNLTDVLLYMVLHVTGRAPAPSLDDQLRPTWLFGYTTREGCSRAGFTEQGKFATEYGADRRCLVKLGCKGPVAKCNVPTRGWVNGVGGCPNVGGICIGCTMPGFPDKYMPFVEPDRWGNTSANVQRFTYGPVFSYFRERNLDRHFDREPEWRHARPELTSGYPESELGVKPGP
jgi:hydrogenase small subunit